MADNWPPWPTASSRSSSPPARGLARAVRRTLTPREPTREPNGTLWFGAELDPGGGHVWFRIAEAADRQLEPGINRFEVLVKMDPPAPTRPAAAAPEGPAAGRPPARGGLRQPEHPSGVLRSAAPPRRLARRPASRRRDEAVAPHEPRARGPVEDHPRREGSRRNGQGKADSQQPGGQALLQTEVREVDSCGIGEEDQHQADDNP